MVSTRNFVAPRQASSLKLFRMNTESVASRARKRREQMGLSQAQIGKRCGVKQQSIEQFEGGEVQRPRYIVELAEALEVTLEWLRYGRGPSPLSPTSSMALKSPQPPPTFPRLDDMPRDVPVEGTAAGNVSGAFQIVGGPVDFVRRPPGIAGAKDVYALYVVGESMFPRFDEGELIYVHPGRPVHPGHYVVVVQKTADHESPQAYVKRLVRRDDKTLVLEQLNPQKTLKLPANTVQSVHRILTMNDLHGV